MTWTVRRGYLDLLGNIKLWAAASGITGPSMYDAVFSSRYTGWPYLRNLYVISLTFPDSNCKTLCPIKLKLDREIDQHHS